MSILLETLWKLIKKYWYFAVIIIMAIILYFLYGLYTDAMNRAKRAENNFSQTITTPDKRIEVLSIAQFKELKADLLDSIQAKIDKGIKAKNISSVTHLTQNFVDSSKVIYKVAEIPSLKNVFDISYNDTCWGFSGKFSLADSTVTINKKMFLNTTNIVVYWQRQRWFNSQSKIMPKLFGKKQNFIETFNTCNAKTKVVKTEVIKRK